MSFHIEMEVSGTPSTPSRVPDPQEIPGDIATEDPFQRPMGYPMLAGLMGLRPQMGIFRRFAYLNAQNLLYMQAELVCLEKQLKDIQDRDSKGIDEISIEDLAQDSPLRRALDWEALSRAIQFGGHCGRTGSEAHAEQMSHEEETCEEYCEQWRLSMKIREKLHRYIMSLPVFPSFLRTVADPTLNVYLDETLIQQMTLASAGSPGPYDLEWIQRFLTSSQIRKGALLGKDWFVWGRKTENQDEESTDPSCDLIALISRPKLDWFRTWVAERLVKWLQRAAVG